MCDVMWLARVWCPFSHYFFIAVSFRLFIFYIYYPNSSTLSAGKDLDASHPIFFLYYLQLYLTAVERFLGFLSRMMTPC